MSEFFLKPDRRRVLLHALRKHDPARAEYFINVCEREILSWLKDWPPGSAPTTSTGPQLEKVRRKAFELFEAVKCLDDQAGWMLLHWLLSHKDDDSFRGVLQKDVYAARAALEFDLLRLSQAAGHCGDPIEGSMTRRSDQDLSDRLARAYAEIFRSLPSTNMEDGVFAAFCEEVANDMPEGVHFTISRTILERSRARVIWILDDSPK